MSELTIIADITDKLSKINIDYMLTGSIAMNFYAEPRMTRDIDIVVEISAKNSKLLGEVIEKEYYYSDKAIGEALEYRTLFNVIHRKTVTKIDLIIRKDDDYSREAFSRKETKSISDREINVISKEDLIISKIQWSMDSKSLMQKRDILNLLDTGYDKKYIVKWLKNLGLLDYVREYFNERYFS